MRRSSAPRSPVACELPVYGAIHEITQRQLREDAEVRHQIAEHYWRANDAIRKHDYETADAELQSIRAIGGRRTCTC